jgi:murein DD-endopeptidase MepM/ murein hydrolase activator NlpD
MACFKGKYKITSPYGNRILNGKPEFHKGVDLVGLDDKTVYAPCDGVIGASTIVMSKANKTWEWGNYVRLDTADGKYSAFMCHLASRAVAKGQKVTKGQKLGVMGNTGYSFGAHTHFEVRKKGTTTTVNPSDVFGIPNKVGTYNSEIIPETPQKELQTGNDLVWQLMNGKLKVEINEPERAVKALDEAKDNADFMSLYWIIRKVVNEHGF